MAETAPEAPLASVVEGLGSRFVEDVQRGAWGTRRASAHAHVLLLSASQLRGASF